MRLSKVIDLMFPPRCGVCDTVVCSGELVCPKCTSVIKPIDRETCRKCGKGLLSTDRLYCYDCSRKIHYFERGFSIFEYKDIKRSLYKFKYQGRAEYATFYAYAADMIHGDVLRGLNADGLIPVPIHKSRQIKRGYNQAALLAKELSKRINVPVYDDFIIRQKATIPLKNLDEIGRANNLKKAFILGSNSVKLKTIVIIDDIYTTGSTIDAISKICLEAGVEKIYFLTVAIGRGL